MTIARQNHTLDIKARLSETSLDGSAERWREMIAAVTPEQVEQALAQPAGVYNLNKLAALISPAAQEYLEEMAEIAHNLTIQRFGRTVQLYAPLYLSNYCVNGCRYCGYNAANKIERTRLTINQALKEAEVIASEGFRHILLVSGRDQEFITVDYLTELAQELKNRFSAISVEIYPMSQAEYEKLFQAGIDGVTLYQETYDRNKYSYFHTKGPKADYDYRLTSHDRCAKSRIRRLGLGVLLGLADWRCETLALAEHADYLMKRYWRSRVSFSFPRLCPADSVSSDYKHLLSDKELVQMMLSLRLCFADAGIVLSTREAPKLRDHLVKICVTKMSAGSKTNPGGYSGELNSLKQFHINDDRTPAQIASMIKANGLEAVWKDWDSAFCS